MILSQDAATPAVCLLLPQHRRLPRKTRGASTRGGGCCRRAGVRGELNSRAHKAGTKVMLSQDEATPSGTPSPAHLFLCSPVLTVGWGCPGILVRMYCHTLRSASKKARAKLLAACRCTATRSPAPILPGYFPRVTGARTGQD